MSPYIKQFTVRYLHDFKCYIPRTIHTLKLSMGRNSTPIIFPKNTFIRVLEIIGALPKGTCLPSCLTLKMNINNWVVTS